MEAGHQIIGIDVSEAMVALALKTRKDTGYYKVPSLKGVWYRGRYLHDASVKSLEEMLNPVRLSESFVPSGFMLPAKPLVL